MTPILTRKPGAQKYRTLVLGELYELDEIADIALQRRPIPAQGASRIALLEVRRTIEDPTFDLIIIELLPACLTALAPLLESLRRRPVIVMATADLARLIIDAKGLGLQ